MIKLTGYGFLLWITVFIFSFIIFPVKEINPPFFETLITIFLCLFTVLVSVMYFRNSFPGLKKAASAGLVWMIINIVIDLPLFSYGPMKKNFYDYFTDIGFTYLIIPVITTGMALFAKNALRNFNQSKDGK